MRPKDVAYLLTKFENKGMMLEGSCPISKVMLFARVRARETVSH